MAVLIYHSRLIISVYWHGAHAECLLLRMCAACSGVEMVGLLMLFLSECSGNATNDAADAEADSTTPKSDGDPWQTDKMYI